MNNVHLYIGVMALFLKYFFLVSLYDYTGTESRHLQRI